MANDISTESEEFSDSFTCSICLDLLYKPVVLSCGHVSCFWCIHRSMKSTHESHCPICRHPYYHFPTISWNLHLLLLKLYPITCKRREEQILEEEKKTDFFSPQFDSNAYGSHAHEEHEMSNHLHPSCTIGNEESNGSCKQLSMTDVECTSCKQMLFHPVFLNCGHGYCETCISCPVDEMLKCQVCQSPHPAGLPKICLELDHFLEEQFPRDYALRREAVQLKQAEIKNENITEKNTNCSTSASKKGFRFSSATNGEFTPSEIHRVGCDYCGVEKPDMAEYWMLTHGANTSMLSNMVISDIQEAVRSLPSTPPLTVNLSPIDRVKHVNRKAMGMFPIIGDRYKCEDCLERAGFDLCGDCYNTGSKRPGKFNQKHTPEHKFVKIRANYLCIPPEKYEDSRIVIIRYVGPAAIPENDSQDSPTYTNARENDRSS